MEKITKLLRTAFYVIVFFLGVTMLYRLYGTYTQVTDKTVDAMSEDGVLFESSLVDEAYRISRAELMALLMGSLQYNVSISDQAYTYTLYKESYSPKEISDIPLAGEWYETSYIYDANGGIQSIEYRYIEN